ncbi:putative uncharacterized domain protein [Xanthomonas citri pv. mangiferaeindicae LMG 941]|nr:putative uncharacterized domain protein [Xanthomonas citri pv. mangiferaeindicae LMG 941]
MHRVGLRIGNRELQERWLDAALILGGHQDFAIRTTGTLPVVLLSCCDESPFPNSESRPPMDKLIASGPGLSCQWRLCRAVAVYPCARCAQSTRQSCDHYGRGLRRGGAGRLGTAVAERAIDCGVLQRACLALRGAGKCRDGMAHQQAPRTQARLKRVSAANNT